eukprot:Amastigsp_a512368_17.p2 type:complete len:130 gc:universal Amastigsp_a512368_17:1095-1484(+)
MAPCAHSTESPTKGFRSLARALMPRVGLFTRQAKTGRCTCSPRAASDRWACCQGTRRQSAISTTAHGLGFSSLRRTTKQCGCGAPRRPSRRDQSGMFGRTGPGRPDSCHSPSFPESRPAPTSPCIVTVH